MVDAIIRFVSIDKPITIPVGVEAVWFPEFGLGDLRCRCGWWVGKLGDRSLFYSEEHETDQPADHPWRSGICSCCFRGCDKHVRLAKISLSSFSPSLISGCCIISEVWSFFRRSPTICTWWTSCWQIFLLWRTFWAACTIILTSLTASNPARCARSILSAWLLTFRTSDQVRLLLLEMCHPSITRAIFVKQVPAS